MRQQGPSYEDYEYKSKEEFKALCLLKKNYFQKEDGCPVGMGGKERIYPRGKGREKKLETRGPMGKEIEISSPLSPRLSGHLQVNNCLKQGENEHRFTCLTYPEMGTGEGAQFDSNDVIIMDASFPWVLSSGSRSGHTLS